jgi:hypothetical protein
VNITNVVQDVNYVGVSLCAHGSRRDYCKEYSPYAFVFMIHNIHNILQFVNIEESVPVVNNQCGQLKILRKGIDILVKNKKKSLVSM